MSVISHNSSSLQELDAEHNTQIHDIKGAQKQNRENFTSASTRPKLLFILYPL